MYNFILGFILSFFIALGGYKKHSLSINGAVSAIILGTLIFYFVGVYFAFIMVAFFISSSFLTKYKSSFKLETEKLHEKGGKRGISQVAANGLMGLIYSLLFFITGKYIFVLGYVTSFASSNSDTWASEIGVLSKRPPLSILTLKPIKKGMSGGVSPLGTFISFLGAVFIAALGFFGYGYIYGFNKNALLLFILSSIGGFLGSIIDSFLGAAIQAKYQCKVCGEITEHKFHHGKPCDLTSGIGIINNDAVNFLSALISSLITIGVYIIIRIYLLY
jgi:uncharacterized protein (TIGR00297 family)